jgi:transposase InsO family protein
MSSIIEEVYRAPNLGAFRGITALYKRISRQYLGITRQDIERVLAPLETKKVYLKKKPRELIPQLADGVMEHWKVDLMDISAVKHWNGEYRYLLQCIDIYSKFLWSVPLKNKEPAVIADSLQRIWAVEGAPQIMGVDRGGEFMADVLEVCARYGVEVRRSKPYSSQTQGAVERVNRTIREAVTKAMGEYGTRKWLHQLHLIVGSYNRTPHSAHQLTPLLVHRGKKSRPQSLDVEVSRRLKATAAKMLKRVARQNAKRVGNTEPGGVGVSAPDPKTIGVADKVLILLTDMSSEKAKGKITAAAEAKRKGRRNRKYTREEYTVAKVRKQFRDDTADRPKSEWKYEMEEIPGELFAGASLLKVTDGLVRQVGLDGRVEMNFGESGPDREATMAEGVRKRAMLRQEQVVEQAEAAESKQGNQVTTRSLLMRDPDNRLLNKELWVRGSYLRRPRTAQRVRVLRRVSKTPRVYAVAIINQGNATLTREANLEAKKLLETLGMDEYEVIIADRGIVPEDPIKTVVSKNAKAVKAAPNEFVFKPPPIRPGDEYMFKGKRYVVKAIAKNGKTVLPVKGPRVNRRDVYKNRVAYVAPPGYMPP